MGDTPSRPSEARPGAPTVGGTTLEAALAQIEDERARAANPPPPPGVRPGEEEVELSEMESDEQMALRLQREEDARAAAPARAPVTGGVYYPEVPYGAPTVGRQLMGHHHPAPPSAPSSSLHRDRHPNDRHHPAPAPPVHPATPYAQPVPYGGFQPPHLTPAAPNDAFTEDDAALARRLQAEEDAAAAAGPGPGPGPGARPPASASDAALAAALQAEEDANARGGSGPGYHPTPPARPTPTPLDDDAAIAAALQAEEDAGAGYGGGESGLGAGVPLGTCPGCLSVVGHGAYIRTRGGHKWHPGCFACAGCGRPITDASHATKDGRPYHVECHRSRFVPECEVCGERVDADAAPGGGMVRWLTHPYWGTAYCPKHETDGTRRCDGCDRVEPRRNRRNGGGPPWVAGGFGEGGKGAGSGSGSANGSASQSSSAEFAELPDGRALCLDCASTAVIDTTHDAPPLYDDVCEFMASVGLPLASRPPLSLVAQDALNAADDKEGWHSGRVSRTRGLCLFEEHVVYAVERTPEWGGGGFLPVGFTERVAVSSRGYAVNAVIVLYGLPAVAAGAVLAHECVHAQIRIAGGYPKLEPKVEEGLCQLVALLWVEKAASRGLAGRLGGGAGAGGKSGKTGGGGGGWEETNLAAMAGYVANQIRTDPSEVYGDGLRAALASYQRHGLTAVFAHVKATGRLPPP